MNDKDADTTPTASEAGFTLWHRTGRWAKWTAIATNATERDAWAAMEPSGGRHGDWLVLPSGREP
jgi:hypothetical protein